MNRKVEKQLNSIDFQNLIFKWLKDLTHEFSTESVHTGDSHSYSPEQELGALIKELASWLLV